MVIPLLLSTVPPEGYSGFLASAFYSVGIITALLVLWKHLFPKPIPQPFVTQVAESLVTKAECGVARGHLHGRVLNLENRMDRVERKMESDKQEIMKAGEDRSDRLEARIVDVEDKLRNDIKEVLRAVSRMEGTFHKQP